MTKLRPQLSTEEALDLVIAALTMKVAAKVTGREPHYLRALSDPDKREKLTVDDAVALDAAYVAAGHMGTPIHDSMGLRLRTSGTIDLYNADLIRDHAMRLAKESGETIAALIAAAGPTPDREAYRCALKEAIDEDREIEGLIRLLRCLVETGHPCADPADPP